MESAPSVGAHEATPPVEAPSSNADINEKDIIATLHKFGNMKVMELADRLKLQRVIKADAKKKQQFLSIVKRVTTQQEVDGKRLLFLKPGFKP